MPVTFDFNDPSSATSTGPDASITFSDNGVQFTLSAEASNPGVEVMGYYPSAAYVTLGSNNSSHGGFFLELNQGGNNIIVGNSLEIALQPLFGVWDATLVATNGTSNDVKFNNLTAQTYSVGATATNFSGIRFTSTSGSNTGLQLNSLTIDSLVAADTTAPTVANVTSSTANGTYAAGQQISIQVVFSEPVDVNTTGGTPSLLLETGTTDRAAVYSGGSGTETLTFVYIIQSGDEAADLDYASTSALALNGATIQDIAGNAATLTLAVPGASGSLGANKALVVFANTPPSVDLNGGAAGNDTTANFAEGSGAVSIAPLASVTDAEGDAITSITVTLTNDQDGASEGLSVSAAAQNALTGVSGASDIVLQDTISISSASASTGEVAAFLQAITYDNQSTTPNSTSRTVSVVINDGTENSVSRVSTVLVTDVTAATSTGAAFDTTDGTNLSPGISFGSGDETLTLGAASHVAGSVANGGTGNDTLVAIDGADLSTLTTLSSFEFLEIPASATVGMSAVQHNGFTSFTDAASQTIVLSVGAEDVTGSSALEAYTLGTGFSGVFTLGVAGQTVTGADGVDNAVSVGALSVSGNLDGGTGSDTLIMGNGSSLAGANSLTSFENLTIASGASVTMTEVQHDGFAAGTVTATGTQQVTISAATDGFTTFNGIETYVLGAANSVTVSGASQNVTGSSGNDTITLQGLTYIGTLNGSAGSGDTLAMANDTNVSGATVSNFENLTLANDATVTMASAQLSAFSSGTTTAAGTETLNVTGDGDFTTLSGIEAYSVADDSTNTRTITLSEDHTAVSATSASDSITFNVATVSFTGALTGAGTNDIVRLGNGSDISAATLSSVSNATIDSGATVTMSSAQHDAFATITGAGTDAILISDATIGVVSNANVSTYTLGAANSITLGTDAGHLGQSISGSSGNDTVELGAGSYTGALNGSGGTGDTLSLVDGSDISGATVSGFENLTIANGATVTIDAGQLAQFSGTITAAGTETILVTGEDDFSTLSNIETFNVTGDATDNARTITIAHTGVDVTASAASDAVVFDTGDLTYTGTITGNATVTDTIRLEDDGNITGATINNVGTLALATNASVTLTAAQYAQVQSETIAASGTETINIVGDGDVTLSGDSVENYAFGDDSSNTRTVAVAGDNSATITANASSDAVTFSILNGSNFSGSFSANADVANTVNVAATGTEIDAATFVGFTNLSTVGALKLTTAQASAFTGSITASGASDTFEFSATGTVSGSDLSAVETLATSPGGAEVITTSAAIAAGKQLLAADAASDAFIITGAAGAQSLTGSAGNDTIDGGSGDDDLMGTAGTDRLTGGEGADRFMGSAIELNGDTITDLSASDEIVLTGFNLTDANVRFSGANTLEIDTTATSFASPEVTITLSNAAGDALVSAASNDGSGTTTISFELANDRPVLGGLGGSVAYTEDGSAAVLADGASVADAELDALNLGDGNYSGATLTLSRDGGADATDVFAHTGALSALTEGEDLVYDGDVLGTVTTNSGGTLRLTFNDSTAVPTTALVNSVLQSITYATRSDTPDASVTINWIFNDGASDSAVETVDITITSANDVPTLSGTPANPTISDADSATPFASLTYADGETEAGTISIAYAGANGSLSGTGLSGSAGSYVLSGGTPAEITSRLQALTFTPTENQAAPGGATQTAFSLTPNDGTDEGVPFTAAEVTATSVNDRPELTGLSGGQTVNENATLAPFAGATVSDPDIGQPLSVTVTVDNAAKGVFTASSLVTAGFVDDGGGVYTLSADTASAAQAALRALVFDPADNRVGPGNTETTTFMVQIDDGSAAAVSNSATTVISTDVNSAPTIDGTADDLTLDDVETIEPFANVTLSDADINQTFGATVTLDDAAKGSFTPSSLTSSGFTIAGSGAWSISGLTDLATLEQALQSLIFQPAQDRVAVGASETSTLTLSVSDGLSTTNNDDTRIIATSVNDPAVISGDLSGRIGEDASPSSISGSLTAVDPDGDDNLFLAVATPEQSTAGLGSYTLSISGDWVFTVNSAAVQSLGDGETARDSFVVKSLDGTNQTISIEIDGANDAPTFRRPDTEIVEADGSTLRLSLFDGASDPEGDRLTLSDLSVSSDRRGDVSFTLTSAGTLLVRTAQFADLSLGQEERVTLSYTLSDGERSTQAMREVIVNGTNRAPVAADDTFFLDGSADTLIGNLLAQNGEAADRDPDGNPLRVLDAEGAPLVGNASTLITLPSGDLLTLEEDGQFTLEAGRNAAGEGRDIVFSYTLIDPFGLRDTGTVTIKVAPGPSDGAGNSWQIGTDDLRSGIMIDNFTSGGRIVFDVPDGGLRDVQVTQTNDGFAIEVDTDNDGEADGSIQVEGTFEGGGFLVSVQGDGPTERIVLDHALDTPDVSEAQSLEDASVNGVTSTAFLTGNGVRMPVIRFEESTAALDSSVGTYVVGPGGTIGDVRMIFDNTNATQGGASVTLDPLGNGEMLGVFLVSGGATASLQTPSLTFVGDTADAPANAFADDVPVLLADGEVVPFDVFHAFSGLNEGGNQMVWSGYNDATGGLTLGFEDMLLDVSDRDYNDVLVTIDFI